MTKMTLKIRAGAVWAGLLLIAPLAAGCGGGAKKTIASPVSKDTITRTATTVRAKYDLPAIASAVITSDTITTSVVGVRKQGTTIAAQEGDQFHIGSCGKAMTATVIAMYVEEGKITYATKLRDILPEIAGVLRPEYADLTLEGILTMRSGLPMLFDLAAISAVPRFSGSLTENRLAFVKWAVEQAPESVPGEYAYSNANYIIAGAIVEKLSGKDWATTMQEKLFGPLGITTVGYGWPASGGAAQPFGHILTDSVWKVHDPDNEAEQAPRYMAPAGDMYMSIGDYAKFVQLHLRGLRGQARLLKAATFQNLHTAPLGGDFTVGAWAISSESGVPTSFYVGSLGTFLAGVKMQSSRNRAVIAITNAEGQTETGDIAFDAMEELGNTLFGSNPSRAYAPTIFGVHRQK